MKLPPTYNWLASERFPQILVEAVKMYGVTETPGPASNPEIIRWASAIGNKSVKDWYKADDAAWCGLFMAYCAKMAGYQPPDGFDAIRAKSWVKWGDPVAIAMLGDILVFSRTGGGHVGLYVGEDKDAYHVLGGNQSDAVTISRISKNRLSGIRRSPMHGALPRSIRRVWLHPSGSLSVNEA